VHDCCDESLWTFVLNPELSASALFPGSTSAAWDLHCLCGKRIPLVGLGRTLFFMPFVVSLVVVALIWKVMLIDKVGFINRMFELVGLQGRSWLGDPNLSRTTAGQMRVAGRHRERGALAGNRGSSFTKEAN
jgi:multiple sugar transport system permease protein